MYVCLLVVFKLHGYEILIETCCNHALQCVQGIQNLRTEVLRDILKVSC
jgi:hypothetical protein